MKKIIILLLLSLSVLYLDAQETNDTLKNDVAKHKKQLPTIVTDRPDQTESSSTIPARTLQIESGVVMSNWKTADHELTNWALGTTLLRYGVWDNFELRLGSYYQITTGSVIATGADSTESGAGPILAGFKVYVIEEKGLRPEISILADITLRHIGSLSYRPTYSFPTAKISASHTLSPKFSLGYNAGFAYSGKNADGFFVYSVVVGYSITSRFGFYGEAFGTFDHGDLPNHRIDGGFTYLARNNLQFDITAGTGFDDAIDMYFLSAGFSWRIPR